ncbi:MAG: hypothetical protein JXB49_27535 [Bacteroidales bacterium]|nr:hypothetical protein [Bacteroidales bacterium]
MKRQNKVIRKVLIVVAISIIAQISISIFQSCCNPDDVTITLQSIQNNLHKIAGIITEGENNIIEYQLETYTPDDRGIRYDSLGIEVANTVIISGLKEQWYNTIGFTGLYACEPAYNFDRIYDIEITSSEDYNTSFPKGSDLSRIMSVSWMFSLQKNSIDFFLIGQELTDNDSFFFTFNFPPDENKIHNITINYTLYDNRVYTTTISNLFIKK